MAKKWVFLLSWIVTAMLLGGCASYRTPGAAVNIPSIAEGDIETLLKNGPGSVFPARVAVVRVQAANYSPGSNSGYGSGRYSVLAPQREDAELMRMADLPQVSAVLTFNPMLLPPALNSVRDMRVIAAKLQADLLVIYTIDTSFLVENERVSPLGKITFGLLGDKNVQVRAATAGMLVDVRTGYIFGLINAHGQWVEKRDAFHITDRDEADRSRQQADQESLRQFVDDFARLWQSVLLNKERAVLLDPNSH